MIDFLIVGFGNTLRGDDGLGPYLVESLEDKSVPASAIVQKRCLPQLDIALIATLAEVDVAIFVDARDDDDTEMVHVNRVLPNPNYSLSHTTHSIDIPNLLGITDTLYGRVPVCYFVKPKGFDFAFSETISENGICAAHLAKAHIDRLLKLHCDETC